MSIALMMLSIMDKDQLFGVAKQQLEEIQRYRALLRLLGQADDYDKIEAVKAKALTLLAPTEDPSEFSK